MPELGMQVEMHLAPDWRWEHPFARGVVVAYSDAPMVLVETPSGDRVWWRADLTKSQRPRAASY